MPGIPPAADKRLILIGTAGGMLAILMWSSTVAVARSLSEQLGPLTSAASLSSAGGLVSLIRLLATPTRLRKMLRLPRRYLFGCGSLFTVYMVAFFLAVGLADGRVQTLEVGLLNYLWPALTIVFSVLLLRKKPRIWLLPGTLLGLAGVFLVLTQGAAVSWRGFSENLLSNPVAYSLGLTAAVTWALYSTLTRRWAGTAKTGAVELFLPATGVLLLFGSLIVGEPARWTARAVAEAAFLGSITWLAYALWDRAMRSGDMMLVAASSYFTPFLSTIVSCLYLSIAPGAKLWIGCAFIVAGALLSWLSVRQR